MSKLIPVILSGGAGTRLWPLSWGDHPKQLHTAFTKGHWSVEKGTFGAQKRTA